MRGVSLVIFVLILWGCSYSKPLEIVGLESDAFKADRGGCEGKRSSQIDLLKKNKEKFLGISENEIMRALGRYDYQVLNKRNEKVFVYYLEPGLQCESMHNPTDAESLVLYMNAVKLVKEVVIQPGGHLGK